MYGRLLAIALFFHSGLGLACSCLWQGPFNEVYPDSDLLVYAEVSSTRGNSFDVDIIQKLDGQEFRESLRVWGKTDDLCRPEVSNFAPGSQWILALQRLDEVPDNGFNPFKPNISFGRKGDYALSSCGVNWLQVKGGRVTGNILDATRWQYLDPKKTPVLLTLFFDWLRGDLSDAALAEAARPQGAAREMLNNTKMFLWQLERDSRDAEELIEHSQ
ncbi:hypothetical protein HCU74_11330 [Spongiibacter sp. KMU-166]|uniref:Delta-aminolevulinic acid dehydratase n=1 Tax=Spongiibacter thalassae TaxID=2721624 RepID=A0ABX1GFL1_9GAMM|nr:hypothetical protein [Spongiibacter thalassae]NKI17995.1 hypothetical protein [Spongiibacter thalassae]